MTTESLLVILGAAVVTYLTRIGGPWLVSRLELSPAVRAWLKNLPGPILIALIAPLVLAAGPAEALAGVAALVAALTLRSLPLAMVAGVAAVWLLRQAGL